MKKLFFLPLFSILFVYSDLSGAQEKMPPPPDGYSWERQAETKSAFLKPSGWFYKKTKQGEGWGYFITKENIDKEGRFFTGLSVFIIPKSFKKETSSIPSFIKSFFGELSQGAKVVTPFFEKELGPFKGGGIVLRREDAKEGAYIVYTLLLINSQTGGVYNLIFEAPAKEWEKAWAIGEPMLKKFMIDTDI
ncbi:MAG: hypothetical protein FWC38_01860 [Proteobacteria bacterium]|nr:hypothetical protein [Pseudomonadota bacterium]MCL2306987.1 hypothetical protein [Pseudomonadota bacterium]